MNGEGLYLLEPAGKTFKLQFKVLKVYAVEKTPHQEMMLVELEGFGKALVIDNFIQSTEADEAFYHESLVHPAMALHPDPVRVLIIGGGEGATLREVLKHGTVREAVMVDIDPVVVEFSKKYLEYMHQGSFNDPRSRVLIMDGLRYVKEAPSDYFDVAIMDLTDPYAGDVAKPLYSEEFYRDVKRVLKRDGVMVTQAGSSYFYTSEYDYVLGNIGRVYRYTAEYNIWIPSFGLNVNFIVASDTYDPYSLTARDFDERLATRGVKTRFINGERYRGLLAIGALRPLH
ncbi:spermidine synthase [Desulfurococcus mucosus]|uniref:Polyamine aminopropyltransferase n=1 Tax=Desulfurococcus mucosus (strain ATCC 35584 / DSM 2162 / JCM 9187 / O7/1) TaxID=765177 RepID=E8R915_DESM0|nr:spermidine synthase [Desulfurococcus mucosus]ADV64991.1 spermidine synthase; spermine synthase [Desulfurococcus mucosus DSM 2162]